MAVKKITRRWLFNSFGVIVVIIVLVEVIFAVGITTYYYGAVRLALSTRANNITARFRQYSEDVSSDFATQVQQYVAGYNQTDPDKVELMIVDPSGSVSLTSSGWTQEDKTDLPDYQKALASQDGAGEYVGTLNNERVMMYTVLAPTDMQDTIAGIRIVTGLRGVDRQIMILVLAMLVLGLMVLAMVLFSSAYFISSIVNPVGEVGETARKIAQGDFGARLYKRTDDEIGELCDIINYMAEELATAEQLKNDFISSVSHELRTPLTAIQGWGETLLADDGQDKTILRKGMGVIISETARLSQMVEELLDFSRMQSGRLRLVKSKIDAVAELSEAVLMYTERARRENIDLRYEETDLIAPVHGDKNKLRQVFVNIIDNAIKYSDQGDTVTVDAAVDGGILTITVTDTGIGIPPEQLPSVKQKFYKADSTRRGSGIGLAVADEIVTRHGGTLEIRSVYGEGTVVTVTLPIYKSQDEAVQVSEQ